MRVLLVEDHRELAESVARGLRRDAVDAEVALDGQQGLRLRAVAGVTAEALARALCCAR